MLSNVREVHITAEQQFGLMDIHATGSMPNLRKIVVLQPYSLRCHCRQREVTDEWLLDQAPSFLYMSGRGLDQLAAAMPECQVSLRYSIDVTGKRWRYVVSRLPIVLRSWTNYFCRNAKSTPPTKTFVGLSINRSGIHNRSGSESTISNRIVAGS